MKKAIRLASVLAAILGLSSAVDAVGLQSSGPAKPEMVATSAGGLYANQAQQIEAEATNFINSRQRVLTQEDVARLRNFVNPLSPQKQAQIFAMIKEINVRGNLLTPAQIIQIASWAESFIRQHNRILTRAEYTELNQHISVLPTQDIQRIKSMIREIVATDAERTALLNPPANVYTTKATNVVPLAPVQTVVSTAPVAPQPAEEQP